MKRGKQHRNRLGKEQSPYLLQHADNPVAWYSWCDEAFEQAKKEQKPIFLSIGYSTCHWCHVMAHESFEDHEVAKLLNQTFICIKVDREERPDIDHLYMTVCQLMTGTGGWPLTLILTPEKKPFFAATYIPKHTRYGRKGLIDLIDEIDVIWREKQDTIRQTTNQVQIALEHITHRKEQESLTEEHIRMLYDTLNKSYDVQYGGFGTAPKFPTPHMCLFLLRYWYVYGDINALRMGTSTLEHMSDGGIHDHLGGGFHRYSTDQYWIVPHFEKMLYDQALLMMAYAEAYQITGNKRFQEEVLSIAEYVEKRLSRPKGGFFSAEDADSDGIEGKYYLWPYDEIKQVLKSDTDIFCRMYDIHPEGNFHDEATQKKPGFNILHKIKSIQELSVECNIEPDRIQKIIKHSLGKLAKGREKRTRPYRDDKILTNWNGLMIAALALSGRITNQALLITRACQAVTFICNHLLEDNGRLLHRFRQRKSGIKANLDDYAFLTWGLLECYAGTFETPYLTKAVMLCETMITDFWDHCTNKGFFFTAKDSEQLLIHQTVTHDSALPAGSSVAYSVLHRLAAITGSPRYAQYIQGSEMNRAALIQNNPAAHTFFLSTFMRQFNTPSTITIIGDPEHSSTRALLDTLNTAYLPYATVRFRGPNIDTELVKLVPELQSYSVHPDRAIACVCTHDTCFEPTSDISVILKHIGSRTAVLDTVQ